MPGTETRCLSPAQLHAWATDETRILRLRSSVDVLPGGYMAALAPALVAWGGSEPMGPDPHVVVRNVNCGGNPLEHTVVLVSTRVPLQGVAFVEFVLVPSTRGGLLSPTHHAQLRFVFEPGREPRILDLSGPESGADTAVPDLVLSWESWRAPDERFNLLRGLDAAAYGLSMRAFAGPQRFLEDQLRNRDWYAYRLRLPGGRRGAAELLRVALSLGDGVARRAISHLLAEGEEEWLRHAPQGRDREELRELWRGLRERTRQVGAPDPPLELPDESASYHALLRSCATLARHAVLTAARRMFLRGATEGFEPHRLPEPVLGEQELWMGEVAQTDLPGLFVWAPLALRFLLRHPEAIPANIPEELDLAGLLERVGQRPRLIRYAHRASGGVRPYGSDGRPKQSGLGR